MKLSSALLVSVLIAFAKSGATYYLGDSLTVTIPGDKEVVPRQIKSVSLVIPGFSISLDPNAQEVKEKASNVTFTCNFGKSSAAKSNPAQVPLPALANLTYTYGRDEKKTTLPLELNVMRRITTNNIGKVLTASTKSQSISVEYLGDSPMNLTLPSSWIVQLMTRGANDLMVSEAMNVTQVMPKMGKMYTLMGSFTTKIKKADLLLLVGINSGTNPFNIYSVAGNTFDNMKYKWVVTDDMKVTGPETIQEFDQKKITVSPTSGLTNGNFWMLATEKTNKKQYAIGTPCAPLDLSQKAPYEFNFEWKVLPLVESSQNYLGEGEYNLSLVYTKSSKSEMKYNAKNNPSTGTVGTLKITHHEANSKTPVSFTVPGRAVSDLGELQAKKNISVVVSSIFQETYVEWFKFGNSSANITNATNDWVPITNVSTPLLLKGATNKTIHLVVPDLTPEEQKKGLRLYGWGVDCANKRLLPTFAHGNWTSANSGGNGGGSSSKLGAGAIVGIVCAVVFVCGVAAWWLCMKNSGGQDRYQKLDH